MAKVGRPSSYKEEYAEQAAKLVLFGSSDEQIAWFFGVDLVELASWAWREETFFRAITPSAEAVATHHALGMERRAKANAGKRRRANCDPSLRVRNSVAARLWAAIRGRSDGKLFSRLGYSLPELLTHLESRFSTGMTWENYGRWHIDHIRPCASFDQTDPDQFSMCWALKNLQPLWAIDNVRKGSRYACT